MEHIQIVKTQSDYFIVQELGTLILNPEFIKEMGEPLKYERGQFWSIAYIDKVLAGFIVYNLGTILYAYTKKEYRNKGIFNELFKEVPNYVTKVVASNMSLPIFIKKGFKITKSYKICHKLQR